MPAHRTGSSRAAPRDAVRATGRRGAGAPPAEASDPEIRAGGRRGAGAPPAEASNPELAPARPALEPRSCRASLSRTGPLARDDLLHLVLGPGDGLLGGRAGHRLGEHVRQDVRVGDELDLVARGRRPAVGVVLRALVLERGELRVGLEDRVILLD